MKRRRVLDVTLATNIERSPTVNMTGYDAEKSKESKW